MQRGSRLRAKNIGFSEDYEEALPKSAREHHSDDPVWLVAGRGRGHEQLVLALIAITAKGAKEAGVRALRLAQKTDRPLKSIDVVYEMPPGALTDPESDFTLLYRRARERGVAVIEIWGTDEWPGRDELNAG